MAYSMKTQLITLSLITTLLFITPLLSSSLRSTYIYFIINVLIVSLGVEAGLLSPTSSSSSSPSKNCEVGTKSSSNHINLITPKPKVDMNSILEKSNGTVKKAKAVEKLASEKIIGVVKINKVKKCPSTPSIFFVGNHNNNEEEEVEEKRVVEEDIDEEEEEELFVKAEIFIGNFYKQLKMQREESWRRIHGVY